MFEKSLYDLIRALRNHRGNEKEYIQAAIQECRKEVRGQDMALKATAILKLAYLEMFGHDMSWASFHVLEVMSSPTYGEKRVGYLAAIQSFRPDTEVLMLAENLLKKDLMSPSIITISLPLTAIPHVVNVSMANSLLSELLPRLNHSSPSIRKKTVVTLYRLGLVYPETLRPAWPRIKERLLDENEDHSVTAAVVNVICELGWRRPQDFIALSPRLFDLLIDMGNNWMVIKIIKLFAALTPLEPRLIKKLLPPLTSIIKTTTAMSLLYECIHGIIQGGILEAVENTRDGEEVAKLCVGKLRNMLVIQGDPNLKYVALLAFQKIVTSHPFLVSLHQDVILDCIDDPDITIRSRALELVVGMVNPENIQMIVDKLLAQLLASPEEVPKPTFGGAHKDYIGPMADQEEEDAEEALNRELVRPHDLTPLPEDYKVRAIENILQMCTRDTYSNLSDFEWYIEVLLKLVKSCPPANSSLLDDLHATSGYDHDQDISYAIGGELQNVAVRVKSMRAEVTIAAQSLILIDNRNELFPKFSNAGRGVLEACSWIVGEYASLLTDPDGVLNSLLNSSTTTLPPHTITVTLQAIMKTFAHLSGSSQVSWSPKRRAGITLLMSRIICFLEPLSKHSDLEVQEVAVEFLELLKLASEAASVQVVAEEGEYAEPPLLLTQAIPSLFQGIELNPVAPGAQKRIEPPEDLDLLAPINLNLEQILKDADEEFASTSYSLVDAYYLKQPQENAPPSSAAERLELATKTDSYSYQNLGEQSRLDPEESARRKAERQERYKDDPFYIGEGDNNKNHSAEARLHNIIQTSNGESVDIDSIPIMDLNLNSGRVTPRLMTDAEAEAKVEHQQKVEKRKKIVIMKDETLGDDTDDWAQDARTKVGQSKSRKTLLGVDSSGLQSLSLEGGEKGSELDLDRREEEEKALREVEKLRLEMLRAKDRIESKEAEAVVKKKKKKKKKKTKEGNLGEEGQVADEGGVVVKKKPKKKKVAAAGDEDELTSRKRGKSKVVAPETAEGHGQLDY